jgi:hypothetical protein
LHDEHAVASTWPNALSARDPSGWGSARDEATHHAADERRVLVRDALRELRGSGAWSNLEMLERRGPDLAFAGDVPCS